MTRRSEHDDDTQPAPPATEKDWRFDRYVIQELVGEGGMGRVYRAHDPRLERTVALKVVSRSEAGDARSAEWLVREARLAAQLEHPNVVAVYDGGQFEGAPFIAMEYVQGKPLYAFMGDATVTLERKLRWLLGVARALAAAHRRRLVHRDIKPGNVLVRETDDVAKVVDFGIARRLGPPAAPASPSVEVPTLTGRFVGTPEYMAPEQLRGESVDGRADQFAWGVTAYALLVGHTPWSADGSRSLVVAVMTQPVQPFAASVAGLDPAVEAAVLRALSKDAADRFAETDELVEILEASLVRPSRSMPVPSRVPPPPDAPTSPTRRDPAPVPRARRSTWIAAPAVALAALVAWGALSSARSRREPAPGSSSSVTPAALAARRGVPVTELPVPRVSNKEALDSYVAALQAYRDGLLGDAAEGFEKAGKIEPGFAAAHLRAAMLTPLANLALSREEYERAVALRGSLDAHDEELVVAFAPIIQRNPADYADHARRLAAAAERYPADAEIALWRAVAEKRSAVVDSPAAFDHALELDPAFGFAYFGKIDTLLAMGRLDEALAAVATCTSAVPSAGMCVWARAALERQVGDCDALERDARAVVASNRQNFDGWSFLAEAVYAKTGSPQATSELLEQIQARDTNPDLGRAREAFAMNALAGDFVASERALREEIKLVAPDPFRAAHAEPARALVELLREEGRDAEAAAFAEDFLRRREGWEADPRAEDFAVARDPMPVMLAAELAAHRIDEATFVRERDAWAADWRSRVGPLYLPYVWAHGWAATAENAAEASEALRVLPDWGGAPPRFAERTHLTEDVGRTLALAGRRDQAIAWTRTAAAACTCIEQPLAHVRARAALGRLLEDTGDREGACAAYRAVVSAWGSARPRSVTASDVKARAARLGCR